MGENWVSAVARSAIAPGETIGVMVAGKDIALYNIDGEFYATDDECTHAAARLSDGWLSGGAIVCPVHAGRFDVKTGKGLGPPIECDVKTYAVRIVGDDVQVDLG